MTIGMLANSSAPLRRSHSWRLATWRLALWDLYLAWRRVMSKVLLGLLAGAYALAVLIVVLFYALAVASNADGANAIRDAVTFPRALLLPGYLLRLLGPVLTCILAGAVVGGEYGFGTHRLSLSRGMSRAQVLTAQALALALIALLTTGGTLLIAALIGVTLGPALGSDLIIPLPDGWLQLLLYWLALALNLWGYMLVALFFATLGRSAAAGIGGSLGLILVELVLNFIVGIVYLSLALSGLHQAADIVSAVPDAFLGTALGNLVAYAGLSPIPVGGGSPSEELWPALVVAFVYCAGMIAGSYLLFRQRDVTD